MRTLILLLSCFSLQIALAQKFTHKINSEEGKCSIAFPAEPIQKKEVIHGHNTVVYACTFEGSVYVFGYSNFPITASAIEEVLYATKKGFMQSVGLNSRNEKTIKKGKIKGIYAEGVSDKEGIYVRYEVYYHNNVVYQIGLMQDKLPDEKLMKAFKKTMKIKN